MGSTLTAASHRARLGTGRGLWCSVLLLGISWLTASGCAAGDPSGEASDPSGEGGGPNGTGGARPDSGIVFLNVPPAPVCEGEIQVVMGPMVGEFYTEQEECVTTVTWVAEPEPTPEPEPEPPALETYECPDGFVRVHVRDMWSSLASPTLGSFAERPLGVIIADSAWTEYAARAESPGCDWYSTCLPASAVSTFTLRPIGPDGCASQSVPVSAQISAGAAAAGPDLWVHYTGGNIQAEYASNPSGFTVTSDETEVADLLCPPGEPDCTVPDGYVRLHIRYPWGDPNLTGFAGTACGESVLGFATPPYPTSLKVVRADCESQDMLEFQNGECPWYSALIPREQWSGNLTVRYPRNDISLATPALGVPAPDPETNEYWLVYAGPRDDNPLNCTPCLCRSVREESYQFYTYNPGPNCPGCGNSAPPVDPCNPPVADGYSPVHFRYIWAGQKIFTFFPKKEFMPTWILMRINGNEYICNREADRPWFNCPIPNEEFFEGASWIATDLEHGGDWNTVVERPFPTEPGEYWIRWHYGKPDIGETSEFKAYDYYPDGTNGDWSATGNWNDEACAPRPPPSPISIGYGGWFPYDETGYAYPYGGSLAYAFGDTAAVQDLLNAFVFERYEMWKERFIAYGDDACGSGTARVMTPLAGTVELGQTHGETVSEGQGYGMAMAAAIGDRELFDQLWNFVRHYLSQSAKKYCGGLMGWMWDGTDNCRPIDVPCDPDTEGCGGNRDSAFDGDIDIGIGLVYAARQWPEYTNAAVNWLLKMECEVNTAYDGQWFYATPGDTWDKDCMNYPNQPCTYESGRDGTVNLSYYGPGYFRVFGDFLQAYLDPAYYDAAARQYHRDFWYKTAETVYEMFERCYDNASIDPGLVADWGSYTGPCDSSGDNYNWARSLWRTGIDAAWFGHRTDLPETQPGSSPHYPPKSRLQAKIDNIQAFFNDFHLANPTALNANRFSSICQNLTSSGDVAGCDPAFGHNSYFVNTAMCGYVSVFDNDGATTPQIRREAIEEAVSTTVMNDRYYQESIGVYTMLFLTGNFPNPMDVNSGGP